MRRKRKRGYRFLPIVLILILVCGFNKSKKGVAKEVGEAIEGKNQARSLDDLDLSINSSSAYENLRDENIEDAIRDYMDKTELGDLEYFYNNIDLNGDGLDEKLVYLRGEYVNGCGGSPLLILDEDYNLLTSISLSNLPVIVSDEKSKGWNNIVLAVAGGAGRPSVVTYEYSLGTYSFSRENYEDEELLGLELLSGYNKNIRGIKIN